MLLYKNNYHFSKGFGIWLMVYSNLVVAACDLTECTNLRPKMCHSCLVIIQAKKTPNYSQ